ncbi:MAG: response regulator [Spirochaetales bacterium]|nr:response regulator [Spirochaetales bacterium]
MKNRILIIEDDVDLCEVLAESFEDEGYSVRCLHNGIAGKEELKGNSYDFLILDIKIPGINGFEILCWLKESGIKIKIIVLTGMPLNEKISKYLDNDNSRETELLHYADAVMNKPFKTDILIDMLKNFHH